MTGLCEIIGERHSPYLRHTQTNVKSAFAPDALGCGKRSCENQRMRVMLAAIREAAGLNLEDMADRLDVATSTVQRWERQTMSIPSERLPAIAHAYGCRINDIFEEDGGEDEAEMSRLWAHVDASNRPVVLDVLRRYSEAS